MKEDICLTCLRVGWEQWLKECNEAEISQKVTLKAKELLQTLYRSDPTLFSSLPTRVIKAGLIYTSSLYLACQEKGITFPPDRQTQGMFWSNYGIPIPGLSFIKSQRQLAEIFGCTEPAIRRLYRNIVRHWR